jgi:hypothetical protein
MSEQAPEATVDEAGPVPTDAVKAFQDTPEVSQDAEPQTFSADYVKQLRDEAAAHRVKAKRLDEANRRTVAGIAELDGRLINPAEITLTADMLDENGIVDKSRVQAAIHALLQDKPYLAKRTPTTTLPQGVRQDVEQPVSLFQLVRERM